MLQRNNDSNSLEQLELARASRVRAFTRGLESSKGRASRVAIFPSRRSTPSTRCQP
jgi:hypothetical protein